MTAPGELSALKAQPKGAGRMAATILAGPLHMPPISCRPQSPCPCHFSMSNGLH